MGFGSSTANRPAKEARTLGQEPDQTTTNQAASPVPWWCGTKRIGVSWIDEAFNFTPTPVYIETKKDSQQSGWSYAVGVAFLLGHGPLDRLERILFDRIQVWPLDAAGSPENADGSPYVEPLDLTLDTHNISITGYGTLHLHRGTDTQTPSTDLVADSGHAHGAMRGIAWGWFDTLELGEGRTNVQNIEIVASRWPVPTWFDLATARVGEFGVNPIAALADFLQNPRVFYGWPEARIDTTTLNAIAADCAGRCLGLSPYLIDAETGEGFVTRICEHIGAVPVILADGTFTLRLIRPTATSEATLDESDFTDAPRFDPEGLSETVNQLVVTFTNADNWWRDDAVSHVDAANYELTGELRSQTLDRPWITSPIMAQIVARTEGLIRSLPQSEGNVPVRLSSVGSILPGRLWRMSYGQMGLCGLPLRCTTLTLPGSDGVEATIEYQVDKTAGAGVFVRPPNYDPPLTPPLLVEPSDHLRVVGSWPAQTKTESAPIGLVLASRTTAAIVGLRAYINYESTEYQEVGQSAGVALHGTLAAALPTTRTMSGETRFRLQLDGQDLTLPVVSEAAGLRDTLLAYIDDEVLSLYDVTLIAAGLYEVSAIRGRYGSTHAAHVIASDVFLLPSRQPFQVPMPKAGLDAVFKIQPVGRTKSVDLADIDPYTAPGTRRSLTPLAPLNLAANGQKTLAGATGDIALTWSLVPDEKPNGFWVPAYDGLTQTVLSFFDGTMLLRTETVGAGTEAFTYTGAMQTADGISAPQTLEVQAAQLRDGLTSENVATLSLTVL
jgi:hypothetical protein